MCHNCFHVRILSFFFSWFDRRNFFLAPLPLHRPPSWEEFQFFSNDNSRHRRVKRGSLWSPYGASLSLSRLYTWEPVQTLPFPSLISLHALLYPFSSFFSFPVPVSEDRARYTCHKAGCKPGFPRSLCRDVVK